MLNIPVAVFVGGAGEHGKVWPSGLDKAPLGEEAQLTAKDEKGVIPKEMHFGGHWANTLRVPKNPKALNPLLDFLGLHLGRSSSSALARLGFSKQPRDM